jgi:transcription initiation factor TFIIIB Brf1 subunit/transcription initiation factor TFIIB
MASCIRLARKKHGLEIDFDSIDNDLGWRVKNFQMYCKIKSELNLTFNDYENELVYKNVHEITTKICNANEFKKMRKIFNDALNIIETASKKGITGGKVPENVAAAAVFLSCIRNGYQISRYDMAKNVKPSSTTIQNIAKELNDKLRLNVSL